MTDWDAELKKIDRQLESISDSAMIPAPPKDAAPAARTAVTAARDNTKTWPAFVRLGLASALAVGIQFWPYKSGCGLDLTGYMLAIFAVVGGGAWSSVWTWKHRTARAHLLSLVLVAYGLVLAAIEILPRVGYAKADPLRPSTFSCVAPAPAPAIPAIPAPAAPTTVP